MDSNARELDMIWLSVLIFLPAAVGLLILALPARAKEVARWCAVFGAAATLAVAMCVWVDYVRVLEFYSDRTERSMYHPLSQLESRVEHQRSLIAKPVPGPFQSFDLVVVRTWIGAFDIQYALGVDGLNLALIILTTLITLLVTIASWTIQDHLRGYLALLMLLETAVIGAFLSLDLFLFFVFYEVMLVPMFFLIGIWGGQNKKYAAIKFVLFTLAGSAGLLAAMLMLYTVNIRDFVDQNVVQREANELQRRQPDRADALEVVEVHRFDLFALSRAAQAGMLILNGQEDRIGVKPASRSEVQLLNPAAPGVVPLFANGVNREAAIARLKASPLASRRFQYALFALLFLGFAVKVPVVPLHSWLPDAHVEAPTPVSMMLAGVLLKLGGYGLIRFAFPLAPWAAAELAWWVGALGVFSIIYAAIVAMGQTDFKKLLAYSSVSHMGYVLLGLAAWGSTNRSQYWEWGVNGAVFQMIAHGITASALFFVVGILYDRAHHRELNHFGGLITPMPAFAGYSSLFFFASMGLPGLCGFVGELMTILAAWAVAPELAIGAILATVLTAGYLLWAWQRVYTGTNAKTANYPDLGIREYLVLTPLAILAVALGVVPSVLVFLWVEPSLSGWVDNLARLR